MADNILQQSVQLAVVNHKVGIHPYASGLEQKGSVPLKRNPCNLGLQSAQVDGRNCVFWKGN